MIEFFPDLFLTVVGMIKRMLEMQLDVPTDQQSLMGWTHGQQMADNVSAELWQGK